VHSYHTIDYIVHGCHVLLINVNIGTRFAMLLSYVSLMHGYCILQMMSSRYASARLPYWVTVMRWLPCY
jgi:hypothetical protein